MTALLNISNYREFTVDALTLTLNEGEPVPTKMRQLAWFQEDGISELFYRLEKQGDSIILVPVKTRGDKGATLQPVKRSAAYLPLSHHPVAGSVLADSVQHVTQFGNKAPVSLQTKVNEELSRMRRSLDLTIEFQRWSALNGKILDHDGTLIMDLCQFFNLPQVTVEIDFNQDLQLQYLQLKEQVEDTLHFYIPSGFHLLGGRQFFNSHFVSNDFRRAYERFQNGEMLRTDASRRGFEFTEIFFDKIKAQYNGIKFIEDDEAFLVPLGIPDLFITRFGPADYIETVNTRGVPYYAKMQTMDFDKGYAMEAQTNMVNLCTNPGAIFKLKMRNAPTQTQVREALSTALSEPIESSDAKTTQAASQTKKPATKSS